MSSETGQRYITEEFGFIPGLKNITPSAEQVGEIGAEIQNIQMPEKRLAGNSRNIQMA